MAEKTTKMRDPIVTGSLNWHITIATILLGLSLAWMFYDETVAKRPWKGIQADFQTRYMKLLEKTKTEREQVEQRLLTDESLKKLKQQIADATQSAKPGIATIDARLSGIISLRISILIKKLQEARGEVMALTYVLEHQEGAARDATAAELDAVKNRKITIEDVPALDDGHPETITVDYYELTRLVEAAKAEKNDLLRQRAALDAPRRALLAKYEKRASRLRAGVSPQQVAGLIEKMKKFRTGIKQINVSEYGLVERCETCHLGIREPVDLTRENIGEAMFVSHPDRKLLAIHDPEKFGCTPCHNGNGAATVSPREAHGRIKHWMYPLYEPDNYEAGCLQCHEGDLVLEGADTLNAGKELFRFRGCWGCHPREGFDVERSQIRMTAQAIKSVEQTIERVQWKKKEQIAIADDINSTDAQVDAALAELPALDQRISLLQSDLIELNRKHTSLTKQAKNPGPSLRPIRSKLNPNWIRSWIKNPRSFRPTTRMPVFRLSDDQVKALAAAVWQAADPPNGAHFEHGDAAHGKELFETRGCQACHAAEKDAEGNWIGNIWGPDLSRVGQKANYDYIVAWIHDTPDWSLMPNLRLTIDEARDLATYLTGLAGDASEFEHDTSYLEDPKLAEHGGELIRHFGCAGCHDIAGFEHAGKIGTELTVEGSKPIERLDFGVYTQAAKRGWKPEGGKGKPWYDHKSFFTHKLTQPEFFDHAKVFESPLERARMPNFGLSKKQLTQLVTFLMGSVDSALPDAMYYNPTDPKRKAIRDGWWVIKKYNCMGCHQIVPGQVPAIQRLKRFQGENVTKAPPSLVGVGARLNPEWLAKFLRNPAMDDHRLHRNGVRSYLTVRMPTFNLWDEEIGALVAFFEALSDQTLPYFPPHYEDMTEDEVMLARTTFLDADCLNCHASAEGSEDDPSIVAPSFVHAKARLKPKWVERWIVDPASLMPGTKMPTGLFKRDPQHNNRWIIAGQMSDALTAYTGDHVQLFVRYISMIDQNEAKLLRSVYEARKPPVEERSKGEEEFIEDDDFDDE